MYTSSPHNMGRAVCLAAGVFIYSPPEFESLEDDDEKSSWLKP